MSSTTTIQFFRSSTVSNSLQEAINKLNSISHLPGQPVISYYHLNEKINCVLALGIKEGIGKDAYSIISTEDKIIVDKVIFGDFPDIMELSEKSLVLCKVLESNKIYWVTKIGDSRVVTEIIEENFLEIKEISTGKYWWVNNKELKESSDFPTKTEFNDLSDKLLGLEKTYQGTTFPIQEKHEKELSKLMNDSYPLQIKFPSNKDVEIFESGTVINIELEVALENKGENITDECSSWMIKRDSIGEFIEITVNKDDPRKKIIIENCSNTETFIIKAIHPDLGEIEKEYKAIFTIKTIIGKIKYPEEIKPSEIYTLGNGLPWDDDNFIISEVINSIPEENKERILRWENEEIIYSGNFNINEYLFIAIPISHKPFSDIIDNTTGSSILDDFELFEKGDEVELNRDYIEEVSENTRNKGMYYLYVRKHGIQSGGKSFSITFKP